MIRKTTNIRKTNTNSGVYLQHAHTPISKIVYSIYDNIYLSNDRTYLILCLTYKLYNLPDSERCLVHSSSNKNQHDRKS